ADIVADTDLNWKNILGEYYQPFKIFMIMENKERTAAYNTKYVQYIPIDIPIYWVDPMSIPIIRTPGGEFVDLMKGSYDEGSVMYDMDSDGKPDAWLNQSTFQREPDSLVEEMIYWKNPWDGQYEDFDRDGIRAQDTDGDGVVDIHDEGDKIRAYRTVWLIDEVPGYDFFDPYVSWEIWLDPPPLVDMAIGASIHEGMGYLGDPGDGYYYDGWANWMEKSESGEVIIKKLIRKTIDSYTGYAFVDSSYEIGPGDTDYGYVPKPRQEYIAVLNLGGREPTMTSPIPPEEDTLYGKISYETLWGNHKTFPIRTSYTYYTPLPNPLQFEYITCAFQIKDPETGEQLDYLPAYDEADIEFDLTASTEYSYYWIMGVGQDFGEYAWHGDEWIQESTVEDGLGDGVFGYMIHEIPKGMGGYSITLPQDPVTEEYLIDEIAPGFEPFLLDHDSVGTDIEVIEYPFHYAILIPQILMPPALDDDNFDGVDDWLDDIGDRFRSPTGCLHDVWPPENCDSAEAIFASDPWDITTPIEGDLAEPHEGWYWGEDETYGDDLIESLGKYRLKINAHFEGDGREGLVPINRGVWLVNEEIFGGSPWVQFSHAQSVYAKGNNIKIQRSPTPHMVNLYPDSVLMRWRVYDADEPHEFDIGFDPWINAQSDGDAVIVTHAGGKDPTGLLDPEYISHARIDPEHDAQMVTAIPDAAENPALVDAGYPKTQDGALLSVVIEVNNNTDNDWYNLTLQPQLDGLGETEPFLWYASYPRPLVPAHVDPATGEVVRDGDDPTIFHAGWRFNSSALEVLNKIGNPDGSATIPELLASRRAYFIFHMTIDAALPNGIYELPISISGSSHHYTSPPPGGGTPLDYEIQNIKFAIVDKIGGHTVSNPEFVIGEAVLDHFETNLEEYVEIPDPLSAFRWFEDGWPSISDYLSTGAPIGGSVSGDLVRMDAPYTNFPPSPEQTEFYYGVMSSVDAPYGTDWLPLDDGAEFSFDDVSGLGRTINSPIIAVEARGSQLSIMKNVSEVNGENVDMDNFVLSEGDNQMTISMRCANLGNDIARNITFYAVLGEDAEYFNTDPRYDFSQSGDTLIWNNPFEIFPGASRKVDVELTVNRDDSYDRVDIMYAFISEFQDEDSETAPLYREMDPDTISYACDFVLIDEYLGTDIPLRDIQIGDVVNISANVHFSGNMKVENIPVKLYENETEIGEAIIPELSPEDSTAIVDFSFDVSGLYHRLFFKVDPDGAIQEADEKNNTAQMEIVTGSGKPLEDILAYPSPFKDYTEFTYVVTRKLEKVELKVFTVNGRLVKDFGEVEYDPNMGYNYHPWDGKDDEGDEIGNGTYIYKLYAQDTEGESYEYIERIVRMR
ncbi:MAG: CARDB domain-containing protein, partial [Candidatus Zixiibacteriota bacterium]